MNETSDVSNKYYNYILYSLQDGGFYIGFTSDLKQRFKEHKDSKVESTKNLKPVKLIFYSAFETKIKALRFEKYLKSSSGFAFRNKHLI